MASLFCCPARENLNDVRFQGKRMRVSTSKHDGINMPKKDAEVHHSIYTANSINVDIDNSQMCNMKER